MLDQDKKGSMQPPARLVAQMRLAASKAGLAPEVADTMAEIGVTAKLADDVAQGIAKAQKELRPLMAAGHLDTQSLAEVLRKGIKAAIEDPKTASPGDKVFETAAHAALAIAEAGTPIIQSYGEQLYGTPGHITSVPPAPRSAGAPIALADRMADGLLARMSASHVPTHGREFASMRLEDMARLGNKGGRFGFRAIMGAGTHTSSDFPDALRIASGKVLLDAYEASLSQVKQASREVMAQDFRPITSVRVSSGMGLDKVNEAGEFTYGTIKDAGEAFAIETYGKIFGLTRQAYVNDDLGALGNTARIQGTGAALTEARLFASLLEKNAGLGPTMKDGKTLFHADHGNLAGAGAQPNVTSLSVARTALRRQKGLSGEAIQVQPAFLIVPPELETMAQQLVASITAASVDQVNPFSEKLEVLVDANLTDTKRWYLTAAPGKPDGLQHAYLDGAKGPQLFTREGFEIDSMEFKVRLDFGCGFVDHRAWFMNPGE